MENETEIRLVKSITANVNGKTYQLSAGRQKVPTEVAEHWYVKAHTDNDGRDEYPDMRDAQIIELSTQNSHLTSRVAAAEHASAAAIMNEQKVKDLTNAVATMTQARDNALAENTEMGRKIGELQTKLDAATAPAAPAADAAVTTTESKSTKK